jgi:hypothetical protein
MTPELQSGVPPSVPGGMAVGSLPVGPINMSDDDSEDDDRLKLPKGIQKIPKITSFDQNLLCKALREELSYCMHSVSLSGVCKLPCSRDYLEGRKW